MGAGSSAAAKPVTSPHLIVVVGRGGVEMEEGNWEGSNQAGSYLELEEERELDWSTVDRKGKCSFFLLSIVLMFNTN